MMSRARTPPFPTVDQINGLLNLPLTRREVKLFKTAKKVGNENDDRPYNNTALNE